MGRYNRSERGRSQAVRSIPPDDRMNYCLSDGLVGILSWIGRLVRELAAVGAGDLDRPDWKRGDRVSVTKISAAGIDVFHSGDLSATKAYAC